MPYIKQKDRQKFTKIIDELVKNTPDNAGELNYVLTRVVIAYLASPSKKLNYQLFNDAIGALEGCKLELYRREISKYEDGKILENKDVYDLWTKLD